MQAINKQNEFWPDDTMYFYTDSTRLHIPFFREYEQKLIILNQIRKLKEKLNIPVSAFSISINHFHLKFYLQDGSLMGKVKQLLRGGLSYEYNKKYDSAGDLWQTRKILQVNTEKANRKISAYIAGNLLKHKEVGTFDELYDNVFSSFSFLADEYGREEAADSVRRVIDVGEDSFGGVDLRGFGFFREVKTSRNPG